MARPKAAIKDNEEGGTQKKGRRMRGTRKEQKGGGACVEEGKKGNKGSNVSKVGTKGRGLEVKRERGV